MLKKISRIMLCMLLLATNSGAFAQKTATYQNPLSDYRDAQELFNKEKYSAAQEKFRQVAVSDKSTAEMRANAEYYEGICGLILFNGDAESLDMAFIKNHPENPKVHEAYFRLANYYFKNKKYGAALIAFQQTDPEQLNDAELDEYYFKTGYSYFTNQDYPNAKKAFYEIINKESKYFAPANYYFAHIAYSEKNYETALKAFRKLLSDENYGKIAPYYLIQIYYYQQNYDEIIKLAPALLDSASSKRAPEIARMTAEAYYQTERYAEALPFLEIYLQKNTTPLTRQDNYMIGFTYYKTNDCKTALAYLGKVNTTQNDSLTQLTYYHSGECYMKTDQKQFAMNMFAAAYKIEADADIQENAMINYAKLTYETAYNPYNEAINVFNQFIEKYPTSIYIDDAFTYLSNIYLSTRNYKDALLALEKIKKRDIKLNGAYQKIAYLRGIELFNNAQLTESVEMLSKSLKYPLNPTLEMESYFWIAEACYRQEKYDSAIVNYKTLQAIPGALGGDMYLNSCYGLGYCYFKKTNWASSLSNFKKFCAEAKNAKPIIVNDAYNRVGDCYFMSKDYTNAIDNYEQGAKMKRIDVDYSLYQTALAQGALGKFETKAATLLQLVNDYTTSSFRAPALFELACTYQTLTNNAKAIDHFDQLIREYPNSSFISQAMLKKGMIYFNQSQNDLALQVLKQVVSDFPGTEDSKAALVSLRNVYVDMDHVEEFFIYVKGLPFANVSDSEQDSITYIAVENRYMRNDCENARTGFKNYLEKFPTGVYQIDANFYLAECCYRAGLTDEALQHYSVVNSKPRSKFTETSLLKSSEINFTKKNYEAALTNYKDLEKNAEYKENINTAYVGQMRCNYQLALYKTAIESATKLLSTEKLSEELSTEAHLTIAKSALAQDSISLAIAEFLAITKISKNEMAAEAKYSVAEIQYNQGNYEESEKTAFDLINQIPSYDYWVAKAFILLADNYVKTNNLHQAKYTLKSIIDNYDGVELVKIAQDKLNAITEAEKLEEQRKAEELLKQQNTPDPNLDINIIK
ncbi:MAG: tetratricopeptide repeat protein [Bacteroidota bacterium]